MLMYSKNVLVLLTVASTVAQGFSLTDRFSQASSFFSNSKREVSDASLVERSGGGGKCPAVWTQIATVLQNTYLNKTTGECTALARQAIRAGFHDCGSWNLTSTTGGCDGSLILAPAELQASENNGMQQVGAFLASVVTQFKNQITTADMIQFSAAVAVVTCPLGPQMKTYVGRKDSFVAEDSTLLPGTKQSPEFLTELFAAKGFSAVELAALLGAHTASQQFFDDPTQAGKPQDDTPGVWDVDFYANTYNPPSNVYRFDSDIALSNYADVGKEFKGFVGNQGKWSGKFADAMTKMSLNGVPGGSSALIDCTSAVPSPSKSRKRFQGPVDAHA